MINSINKYIKNKISLDELINEICVKLEAYIIDRVKEEIELDSNCQAGRGFENCCSQIQSQ